MKRWFGWSMVTLMMASLLWPGTADARPGKRWRRGGGFGRIARMLNLTPQQREKIKSIRYTHRRKMIPLRAQLQLARLDVRQLSEPHRPDIKKVMAAVDKMGKIQLQVRKARILMRLKMKAVLTPEQAAKASQLRKKRRARWRRMRRRWRRGRRGWRRRMRERMNDRGDDAPAPAPPGDR